MIRGGNNITGRRLVSRGDRIEQRVMNNVLASTRIILR